MRADQSQGDLAVRVFGTGRRVAALHGFTLTGAQFAPFGSDALQIHAADLPGHGETHVRPVDVPTTVGAIARWLSSFEQPVPLVGYSLGGRMALLAALDRPDLVEGLILVSASPGIAVDTNREVRRARDDALAHHIETAGTKVFLDEWLDSPMAGTDHHDDKIRQGDRAIREVNTSAGLASALRGLGQGAQPYVGDRLGELEMPLLTVSGSADAAYTGLAREMAAAAPHGTHVSIEGAGHNVILDAPQELIPILKDFAVD